MKGVGTFLIAVALIAGMVGCDDDPAPLQYNLTIVSTEGGAVTATVGDVETVVGQSEAESISDIPAGTTVELTATPAGGYHFVNWTGDVGTIADIHAASTTITINDNYSITANFEEAPPLQYNLTISSTAGGSVMAPGEGTFIYDEGTVVDLAVEAEQGCQFTRWSGDVGTIANTSAASTTIGVDGDYVVIANFEEVDPGTLFAGGSGTPGDPYQIANWTHLHNVRDYLSSDFILISHLHATTAGYAERASQTANDGKGWEPIGYLRLYHEDGAVTEVAERFEGTFDGRGYEIRDLFINRPDEWAVGVFGAVAWEAVIEDLGVVNATVTGYRLVGGLVGRHNGTVNNSYATGSVAGQGEVGGLVGENLGSVSNSWSATSVIGNWYVGGLVGWTNTPGTINNSYSTGSVTGEIGVGGLLGLDSGAVSNSHYNCDEVLINGQNIITIGALFGEDFQQWLVNDKSLDVNERLSKEDGYYVINDVSDFKELLAFGQDNSLKFRLTNDLDLATEPNFYIPYLRGEFDGNGHRIINASFSFDFIAQVGLFGCVPIGGKVTRLGAENVNMHGDHHVGGLVGDKRGSTVSNSYSTGSVTGSDRVGGLMGANWGGPVSNSYSTASVAGHAEVGGLIGDNRGEISNSYANGSVTGTWRVGGLVGINLGPISNSYSTGSVAAAGGYEYLGGLVAFNQYGTVTNSFWDTQTSGQATSDGGTAKTTAEMQDIITFSGATWDIVAVANPSVRNPTYIWNIVDDETYPFLSWQPVS